jgi:hypothetical protein
VSGDERIVRLTELARRVWPDEPRLVVDHEPEYLSATVLDRPWHDPDTSALLKVERHPCALDALEAALLVLAAGGRITPQVQAAHDALVGDSLAWVEQLATQWERESDELRELMRSHDERDAFRLYGEAKALSACAAKLRERAKAPP